MRSGLLVVGLACFTLGAACLVTIEPPAPASTRDGGSEASVGEASADGAGDATSATTWRIYFGGGDDRDAGGRPAETYFADLDDQGNLGQWRAAGAMANPVMGPAAVLVRDTIVAIGGENETVGYVKTAQRAKVAADGTLEKWIEDPNDLPKERSLGEAVAIGSKIVFLTGVDNDGLSAGVFSTNVEVDGRLGAWAVEAPIPGPRDRASVALARGYLYVLGGVEPPTDGGVDNAVSQTAFIGAQPGIPTSWRTRSIPHEAANSCAIAVGDRIHLIAGLDGANWTKVTSIRVREDGDFELPWEEMPRLASGRLGAACAATDRFVLVFGGLYLTNNQLSDTIEVAPIEADGRLGEWRTLETKLPTGRIFSFAVAAAR